VEVHHVHVDSTSVATNQRRENCETQLCEAVSASSAVSAACETVALVLEWAALRGCTRWDATCYQRKLRTLPGLCCSACALVVSSCLCCASAALCPPCLLDLGCPSRLSPAGPCALSSGHQNSATSAMIERGCCRGALATYAAVAPEQRTAAQRAALSKCWPNSPPPHRPRGSQRPTAAPADETSVRSSAAQSRASTYVVLRMTE